MFRVAIIILKIYIFYICVTLASDRFSYFSTIGSSLKQIGNAVFSSTVCNVMECCTDKEIPADFDKLEQTLKAKIYGQHLVLDVVMNALQAHWSPYNEPHKPLTLSFHGWPGGGKNYISNFIKDSLYLYGDKSVHVHHFIGRIHFPLTSRTEEYKNDIYQWVKSNVTKCARQLFIFDEVDKIPPGTLDNLKPLMDYVKSVENVDYRQAIFIFLSNIGGSLITQHILHLYDNGYRREEIRLSDFENIIAQGAFNEVGGFHHSDTIKSNLIDHYIPFLPMEREHVELCVLDEFVSRGVVSPPKTHIAEVMEFVEWGPTPGNLFSKTGCKRLSQKIAMLIQKHNLVPKKKPEL